MSQSGRIWITTREEGGSVEFRVGNSGSHIPAENIPNLFDAFFTSGKVGGTGLGLAIAHKVVTAHGGRIRCESARDAEHPDGRVEFIFTLPAASGEVSLYDGVLPARSLEITANILGSGADQN